MAKTTPIEETIARLLRKAESTDSPAEAEALTEHAERLMIKHGIERTMLDLENAGKTDVIIKAEYLCEGTYAMELAEQGMAIIKALGMQAFFVDARRWGFYVDNPDGTKSVKKGVKVLVVGFASEIEQATALAQSLQVQSMVAVKHWANANLPSWYSPREKYVGRRSFISAFGSGAAKRIRENRRQIVEEEFSSGKELILVTRPKQVEDWVEENMKVKKVNTEKMVSYAGHQAGHHAGTQAATGERGLTQGRAITA